MDRQWSKVPRTLYVTGNTQDICTMWRVWWPAFELTARGYVADYCTYQDFSTFEPAVRYGRYNTIVTPRMAFTTLDEEQHWLDIISAYRPKVRWWYDCDDDLWSRRLVDRLLATHRWPDPGWAENELEFQRLSRIGLLSEVDGVTVASQPLANIASEFCCGPVVVVPNGINVGQYRTTAERSIPPLTIGWSGGPRLQEDLDPLYEVWPKVAELRPDVHFVLQGWVSPRMLTLLPANRLHCTGGLANEEYVSFLRNIDIFCCVATDDPWVACKTPIKWFEATLAGSACVVSDHLYGSVVNSQYGPHKPATALVARTADEWLQALLLLVDEQDIRRQLQTEAAKVVLANHTVSQTYTDWLSSWGTALAAT